MHSFCWAAMFILVSTDTMDLSHAAESSWIFYQTPCSFLHLGLRRMSIFLESGVAYTQSLCERLMAASMVRD